MAGGGKVKIKGGIASHGEATVIDGALLVEIVGGIAPPSGNFVETDGSTPLTGNWAVGGFNFTNVGDLTLGTAGGGNRSLTVQSSSAADSGVFFTTGSDVFLRKVGSSAGDLFIQSARSIILGTGASFTAALTLSAAQAATFAANVDVGLNGAGNRILQIHSSVSGDLFRISTFSNSVTVVASGCLLSLFGDLGIAIINPSGNNVAALAMTQNDSNEPFLRLVGTSSADAASSISSLTAGNTIQGFVRQDVNGTDRWVPFYDAPVA